MDDTKLYEQANYLRPTKMRQEEKQQASNVPLEDGFTRSKIVDTQPSEMANMGDDNLMDKWDAERENVDIERGR